MTAKMESCRWRLTVDKFVNPEHFLCTLQLLTESPVLDVNPLFYLVLESFISVV